MTDFVRLFIALDLPEPTREALASLVASLRPHLEKPFLRFIPREDWHVTLKFLGSVNGKRVPELSELVRRAALGLGPIQSSLTTVSAFSAPSRARVVIVKLADPNGALASLAARVEHGSAALGFAPEARSLTPHVTIARLREPRNLARILASVPLSPVDFQFETLTLYASETRSDGSRYRAMTTARLSE